MKLSKNTISILQNYSQINKGIHFKKGNVLRSINSVTSILSEAVIDEKIPQDFTIHNLETLLAVEGHLNNPDFNFKDDKVVLQTGRLSVNYGFADPSTVISVTDTYIDKFRKVVDSADVKFTLSQEDFESILQAARILHLPEISVRGNGTNVSLVAIDQKNTGSNTFVVDTETKTDKNFEYVVKVDNLKVIPGSYDIAIKTNDKGAGAVYFKNQNVPIQYWIALETQVGA